MAVSENSMMLMTLSTSENGSISPLTPSPSREMRGIRLFRAISRRLAKRAQEEFEEDSRSSSTDSSCKGNSCSSGESGFRSVSPHHMSSSSSETGSDKGRHPFSTSAESIRKVFQSLSINSQRSKSCNNTKENKRKSKKSPPKKILRPPVSYTYVKGLSGLPTQRVPKGTRVYNLNSCGGCSIQYMAALHR